MSLFINHSIPDRLRQVPRWICWANTTRDGKSTQLPCKPYTTRGGQEADPIDSDHCRDFQTAYRFHGESSVETDGLAFMFTGATSFIAIALLDCRSPDEGEIADWAWDLIEQLDSYTEVSPSGTDIHVVVEGDLQERQARTDTIELYVDEGCLPITGNHVDGTPEEINPRQAELSQVYAAHIAPSVGVESPPTVENPPATPGTEEGLLPVEREVYPAGLCSPDVARWLTWKEDDDDGEKIPRAPHVHSSFPDKYADSQDSALWTDFETAHEWANKLPGHNLAFVIRNRAEYPDEDLVLIDYDDVRDPETETIHPTVRDHLEAAGSYADLSPSGTGIHILCRGSLPGDMTALDGALPADERFPDASIEVYASARFVTMTGRHLLSTPRETQPAEKFLARLADVYAPQTESSDDADEDSAADASEDSTADDSDDSPDLSKAELRELETTTDMQVVYHAIDLTEPGDIRLDSPVTEERSDGTKSRDPSWAYSESGTRLAELEEGWVYRKGMIGLDALQVVALEEGIITDEYTYPSGHAFWEAVRALRTRGAPIPRHLPSSGGGSWDGAADADGSSADTAAGDAFPSGDADSGGESATESVAASGESSPASSDGGSGDTAPPADAEVGGDLGAGDSSSTDDKSMAGDSPEEESSASGEAGESPESPETDASSESASDEMIDLDDGSSADEDSLSPAEAKSQFRERVRPDSGLRQKYGTEHPEIEDWPLEIALHELPARKLPTPLPRSLDEASGPGHDFDDEEVLSRAFDSKSGEKIERLYEGDPAMWEGVDSEYRNAQTAASGLLFHLAFWTAGDLDQMDRLFRQSGLLDEEWDRFLYPPNVTFGEVALAKAAAAVDEYYTPPSEREPEREPWGDSSGGGDSPGRADPAALRGTEGGIDVEAAFDAAQMEATRARRYEQQFRECERQLSDCRELVRELWERLRLYREAVGVDPERKHGLDPETLTAAGIDAVTEAGPAGRPPSPPGTSAPREPAREEGVETSGSRDTEAARRESVEWSGEPVAAGDEPREPFVPDRAAAESDAGDTFSEDATSEDDDGQSGFFSRFFS